VRPYALWCMLGSGLFGRDPALGAHCPPQFPEVLQERRQIFRRLWVKQISCYSADTFTHRFDDARGIHPGSVGQLRESGILSGSDIGVHRVDARGLHPYDDLSGTGCKARDLFELHDLRTAELPETSEQPAATPTSRAA